MLRGTRPVAIVGVLLLGAITACGGTGGRLPFGALPPPAPADNRATPARVELGRRLFYEADLSIDGTMACATCHEQHRGFADGNRTRPGVHGDPGRRNVPGLANVACMTPLTWADPRQTTLETQVSVPLFGERPVEMGMKGQEAEIARRLGSDACYVRMFRAAFPDVDGRIDMGTVARALAAFQRSLVSADTRYDRVRAARARGAATPALPAGAARGEALFGRHCATCHAGPDLSDRAFHRLEPAVPADRGLGEISGATADDGRFRTPGLRNVALTAPYFHDGDSPTLADAITRHGAPANGLPAPDVDDLILFLQQLTDPRFVTDPRFALPQRACGRRL